MHEWEQFLSQLNKELGEQIVKKWIPELTSFDAGNIYLQARDSFQVSWFDEHIKPRLKGLVNNNSRPIKVHLDKTFLKAPVMKREEPTLSFTPSAIDPEMTFENYVSTDENLVVYKLLTETPPFNFVNEPPKFNPIFLYGPKGSGKTHLLMAAANSLKSQGLRVYFVRAETFTEHVVQAMRLGKMQDFRKVYRDIDVLVIDDIHIFSRKNATQEEFFHTFNTLHTAGKTILISANISPMQLIDIEPRLISRFEWGISLPLQKGKTKDLLEKKSSIWNINLSNDLTQYLVEKFPNNPIQALTALTLRTRGETITRDLADKVLKDLIEKEGVEALTFEKIVKSVANQYGIKGEDLLGKSQAREFALPRQIAMYLCREKLNMPFQTIGRHFSRDHSTVMSSVKQIQKSIDEKKLDLTPIVINKI